MAQRLVRTICPDCKTSLDLPAADLPNDFPKQGEITRVYHGTGCRSCRQTGYRGRTGIYELMVTGNDIREMCVQRMNAIAIRNQALKDGMITLRQDGWRKVVQGITTIEEVARTTQGDLS